MAYRFDGKQKHLSFGAHPAVSLIEPTAIGAVMRAIDDDQGDFLSASN